MSEDKKIEELIKKYKEYFDNSNADVCKTIKGVWFFYRYDTKTDYFECFYRFNTADELKRIIASELVDDTNMGIEMIADDVTMSISSIDANDYGKDCNYDDRLNRLLGNLEIINKHMHTFGNVFQSLQGILSEQESK